MKKTILLACLGFAFAASAPAFAAGEKMKGCSKEATGMKGDERKAFMKKCLSKDYTLKADAAPAAADKKSDKAEAKPAAEAAAPVKQQDKMKHCNEEAKSKALKGDERKAFMGSCLKK
ncbi:MAG: PsiF repeat-containing protein [Nitrosomonadales bacterium]|nr:PsiF repeat-containing protein [Nitrosomonadales bacterium]